MTLVPAPRPHFFHHLCQHEHHQSPRHAHVREDLQPNTSLNDEISVPRDPFIESRKFSCGNCRCDAKVDAVFIERVVVGGWGVVELEYIICGILECAVVAARGEFLDINYSIKDGGLLPCKRNIQPRWQL